MEATALLREEHEAMRHLFRQYSAAGPDAALRRTLVRTIKAELHVHTCVEEEVFYPAVMRVRAAHARTAVRDALGSHHEVEGLLAELEALEPEDALFDVKVAAMREALEHHMQEEEARIFAEARIHLTDDRLERLGRLMVARRDILRDLQATAERVRAST